MRGPLEQNPVSRSAWLVTVGVNPVEAPVERPHDAVLGDRMQAPLPCVKEICDHTAVYTTSYMDFVVRLLINAAALWIAIQLVDGIDHRGTWWSLVFVALVFGVLNASVRPLLKILSLPLLIVTLGLFIFVINGVMLLLTGWVSDLLDLGFYVDGFWAAFRGGLVVTVVSLLLSLFTGARSSRREGLERPLRQDPPYIG
jgi:putative membrane protein